MTVVVKDKFRVPTLKGRDNAVVGFVHILWWCSPLELVGPRLHPS